MSFTSFNAHDYDTSSVEFNSVVLPAGEYTALIHKCQDAPNKAATGTNITIQWKIQDANPEYNDAIVFQNIIFDNPSVQATEIGRRMLARVCKCCNVFSFQQSVTELEGNVCIIKVAVEKRKDNGEDRNVIRNVFMRDTMTGQAVDPDAKPTTAAPTAKTNLPPKFVKPTK